MPLKPTSNCCATTARKSAWPAKGKPRENGYVERLIRTIKEVEANLSDYQTIHEARDQLGYFIDVDFNQLRPHSGLDYQRPAEREAQWLITTPQKI